LKGAWPRCIEGGLRYRRRQRIGVFASILDALPCAIEIQKAMDHVNGPSGT